MTEEEFENLKAGEKFNLGYRFFEVKKGDGSKKDCLSCCFNGNRISFRISCSDLIEENILPCCIADDRQDKEHIYFEEVENDI